MTPKRVLLTGGLGFIGAHTVEHWLATTDWEIVVLDALRFSGRVERLTACEGYDPDRVSIYWHDLRAPIHDMLAERIDHVDYIVNMASDSHVDRSIDSPVDFVHNNVMLALHMLEFARQAKPQAFIQVGTDEVFGPAPGGVSHDEDAPLRPSNPYSASKAAQMMIAFSYWRTYGVPLITTQTMNNFGERQHPEKFVPMTIRKVLDGDINVVHAEHTAEGWKPGSRVWLHARNHADAIRFILQNVAPVPFAQGVEKPLSFNVAGDREITNLGIVEMVADILGVSPVITMADYHSSRPGHDLRYSLDGSALRAAGWQMPVSTEESFERTVRWAVDHPEWLH